MRMLLVVAATVLLTGCRSFMEFPLFLPMGRNPYGPQADNWAFRSAVLFKMKPVFDNQSDLEKVSWGILFYRPGSEKPYFYSNLGASRRGIEEEGDGVFWVTMPAGEYRNASFYTLDGNELKPTQIPGQSFGRFTLVDGELKVLGTADVRVSMRPAREAGLLSGGSTKVVTTVKGSLEPGTPAELAKAALARKLGFMESREGWETRLQALASGR